MYFQGACLGDARLEIPIINDASPIRICSGQILKRTSIQSAREDRSAVCALQRSARTRGLLEHPLDAADQPSHTNLCEEMS